MESVLISGGVDEWSRQSWDPFGVGAEHTVFEWCMIYTDRHPSAFLGPYTRSATAEHREVRLTLLGTNGSNEPGFYPHPTKTDEGVWRDPVEFRTSNAVYRELANAITDGRLDAKRVYLDDRPDELDLTLCVIDAAPMLAIAKRRQDYGQYIASVLAGQAAIPREDESRQQQQLADTPPSLPDGADRRSANRRGPKRGSTGFNTADNALCPTIDQMLEAGEARSAIAAALDLVDEGKVAGGGTRENRAARLARRYGKWPKKPEG
jgi:hypothetical protein